MCRLVVIDKGTNKVDYIHSFDKLEDAKKVKELWDTYFDSNLCEIYVLQAGKKVKRERDISRQKISSKKIKTLDDKANDKKKKGEEENV